MNMIDIIFGLAIHRGKKFFITANDCQDRYKYQKRWFSKWKKEIYGKSYLFNIRNFDENNDVFN